MYGSRGWRVRPRSRCHGMFKPNRLEHVSRARRWWLILSQFLLLVGVSAAVGIGAAWGVSQLLDLLWPV